MTRPSALPGTCQKGPPTHLATGLCLAACRQKRRRPIHHRCGSGQQAGRGQAEQSGSRAEDVDPLTEPELYFESVCIEHKHLEWGQGEVGGQREDSTAMGMDTMTKRTIHGTERNMVSKSERIGRVLFDADVRLVVQQSVEHTWHPEPWC